MRCVLSCILLAHCVTCLHLLGRGKPQQSDAEEVDLRDFDRDQLAQHHINPPWLNSGGSSEEKRPARKSSGAAALVDSLERMSAQSAAADLYVRLLTLFAPIVHISLFSTRRQKRERLRPCSRRSRHLSPSHLLVFPGVVGFSSPKSANATLKVPTPSSRPFCRGTQCYRSKCPMSCEHRLRLLLA